MLRKDGAVGSGQLAVGSGQIGGRIVAMGLIKRERERETNTLI